MPSAAGPSVTCIVSSIHGIVHFRVRNGQIVDLGLLSTVDFPYFYFSLKEALEMTRPLGSKNKPKLAAASAPRLPYPTGIYDRFGIDALQWKVLVEAVLPDAPTADSVIRVLSYCKTCADAYQKRGVALPVPMAIPDEPGADLVEDVRDGEPPPRIREDPGPVDPGFQPRVIPGKNESCETWAEKYIDCLKTSQSVSQAQTWRRLNAEPLDLLTKRKPSVAAGVRKAFEDVIQALDDEEHARLDRLAKTAAQPQVTA